MISTTHPRSPINPRVESHPKSPINTRVESHPKSVTIPPVEKQLRTLSNSKLLFQMQLVTRGERAMTIKILHHLNEIERRRLYLDLGCSSLFDYCTRHLKYSSSAAGRRIHVARCIRRHPDVLELLRARELSLSTISLIAPILDRHNEAAILSRVRGKSYREVERVASEYRPPIALRDRVRSVRVRVSRPLGSVDPVDPMGPVDVDAALFDRELQRLTSSASSPDSNGAPYPGEATPGAGSNQVGIEHKLFVQFVAGEELMEKFERARALLSHRCGEGSFAEVLDVVLAEFVDRHSPEARLKRRERQREARKAAAVGQRKAGVTTSRRPSRRDRVADAKPRSEHHRPAGPNHSRRREWQNNNLRQQKAGASGPRLDQARPSRHIPAAVRDDVFVRDGGACTFAARDGTRCGSKQPLQIDHVHPFAAGGAHDRSNLRLLCAGHNRLAAEQTLGTHRMKRFWRKE